MTELRRYWLLIAIPAAVAFAFATPPFQAPDEAGHYFYANAIAKGHFFPDIVDGVPTTLVPRGVRDILLVLWVNTAGKPGAKVGTSRISAAARVPRGSDEVPVHFPAQFTPVPYAATALACWLGNLFRIRPLFVFYLGRLLNAGALILLTYAATRRAATAGARIAAVALLPMSLYLGGSFSPDAITIGIACYATALAATPQERPRDWSELIVAAALLALSKPVYFLLPLLALAAQRTWRGNSLKIAALAIAITAALSISAWTVHRNYFAMRHDAVTSTTAQLSLVEAHPLRFVCLAAHDYGQRGLEYIDQMVGRLGWLDIFLPRPLTRITFALLLLLGVLTPADMTLRVRIAGAAIVIATCALVTLSQYLAWTPVGANEIDGIQGRYLLPLVPLVLTIVGAARVSQLAQRWAEVLFAAAAIALNLIALTTIVHRYY